MNVALLRTLCLLIRTLCLSLLVLPSPTILGGTPWEQPVGRSTNDRDADLLAALIEAGRFDDAIKVCSWSSRGADRASDVAAKWAIRQSEVLTARQMAGDRFEDADLEIVGAPVRELLRSYPEHRRRLFLLAQITATQRSMTFHSVLRAAVSPSNDATREEAARRVLRSMDTVLELSKQVDEARSLLEKDRQAASFALIADLVRLQQELQTDTVSLALVQTELFPPGSADCIAAATTAEQAASDAITRLPTGTKARNEVERLKVESIFRAGQFDRADQTLSELVRRLGQPLSPQVQSLQVRLDIARGRMEQAGKTLVAFYGDSPEVAPRSTEMDLARLEFLLLNDRGGGRGGDRGQGVGAWLDAIQQRGGAYARRRAEAMSLARLRTGDAQQGGPMIDPSLIAAQGQDWLRRGDPSRAGDLLSAAAAAESDPDRAIKRAGEAAAALMSADRSQDASQLLADISLARPSGAMAAATHLQAVLLVSSNAGSSPDSAKRVEAMLLANLKQWPSGKTATAARNWLKKLLTAQQRYVEAAEVATAIPLDEISEGKEVSEGDAEAMANAWAEAFRRAEEASYSEVSERFHDSFRSLLASRAIASRYRQVGSMFLDREGLASLETPAAQQGNSDRFVDALIKFRIRGEASVAVPAPPQDWGDDVETRLMSDGRKYADMRAAITAKLESWKTDSKPTFLRAERLLWKGRTGEAIGMLRALRTAVPDPAEATEHAAKLLGSQGDEKSRREAIKLWDELASGSKQGSHTWHEAKLAAIDLLRQLGDTSGATRRAKYILLTHPNMASELSRRYRAVQR